MCCSLPPTPACTHPWSPCLNWIPSPSLRASPLPACPDSFLFPSSTRQRHCGQRCAKLMPCTAAVIRFMACFDNALPKPHQPFTTHL